MKPEKIVELVRGIPHTTPERGRMIYDFILENKLKRCLELGFAHGVGSVWMGGAVQEIGGNVIGVDNQSALQREPDAKGLLKKAGLEDVVELHFDPISYTWHLQREMARYVAEPFDFIFLDGAHTWDTDGFTFFLCEKVLKPGGWILFDDMNWCYADSPAALKNEWVQKLTPEELNLQQVRKVWEELVVPHPSFGNFRDDAGWGWAQKSTSAAAAREMTVTVDFKPMLKGALKRVGIR